jgi:AcrR family transcriptional regulator
MDKTGARLSADERKAQLLRVGRQYLAQSGCPEITTKAIAQAAGVTEPVIYAHFPTKQRFLLEVVRAIESDAGQRWRSLLAESDDPLLALKTLLCGSEREPYNPEYRVIWRCLMDTRDRELHDEAAAALTRRKYFFMAALRQIRSRGGLQGEPDLEAVALQLMSLELGVLFAGPVLSSRPLGENVAEIWRTMFRGVFCEPAAGEPRAALSPASGPDTDAGDRPEGESAGPEAG